MIVTQSHPFEELQKMCRKLNAPVYVRHKRFTGDISFVRRTGASVADVEQFFASYTGCERDVSEK